MKTLTFLILILFCANCFSMTFQIHPHLHSIIQKGLYSEVSDAQLSLEIDNMIETKSLSDLDYDYLGDAIINIYEKNPQYMSSYKKFNCYSPDFKDSRDCEVQREKLITKHNAMTSNTASPANAEILNTSEQFTSQKMNSSLVAKHPLYLGFGVALIGFVLFDFFQKNEIILEANF